MLDHEIQSVVVFPANDIGGALELLGDKSISHRIALLALLSNGASCVRGFLRSEDCLNTLRAIEMLGAKVSEGSHQELLIEGAMGRLLSPLQSIDLGNSGTGIRLLTGLLAGCPMHVELTGDESLCSRPMGRIREPLEAMGGRIDLKGKKNTPPIGVCGGGLHGIEYALPVASAQVKSSILFASLFAEGKTVIIEPTPTRDHTERLFQAWGIHISVDDLRIELEGYGKPGPPIKGRELSIPGDFSSAAFWIAAVAGREGCSVRLKHVGLNPRRIALIDVLKRMGASIEIKECNPSNVEPYGNINVQGSRLYGTVVGGDEIPNLIDELPLVAIIGAIADGVTEIKDAKELRVKESDRVKSMVINLRAMNVQVEEKEDGMIICGTEDRRPCSVIDSYGDHRIAMSMAILALYGKDPVSIKNTSCIKTSYPGFWSDLKALGGDCAE
ncbi:MAG: 3-phosphoshikimate 1-carboxyvinyltransferase [Kiritimatiellae bacterium]|nr:3-phosphoshikimate 1-carboxyvinyltransferase [Kiritimatiellia bacterium]